MSNKATPESALQYWANGGSESTNALNSRAALIDDDGNIGDVKLNFQSLHPSTLNRKPKRGATRADVNHLIHGDDSLRTRATLAENNSPILLLSDADVNEIETTKDTTDQNEDDERDKEDEELELIDPAKYAINELQRTAFTGVENHKPSFRDRLLFRRAPTDSELQRHQIKLIKAPLTFSRSSELAWMAVKSFRKLTAYMGDRSSSKPPLLLAREMVQMALQAPESVRDEIYIQVIKQCCFNGNPTSLVRGFQLLAVFSGQFPPSSTLAPYVRAWLRSKIKSDIKTADTAALEQSATLPQNEVFENDDEHISKLCEYALLNLQAVLKNGARVHACSEQEIEAYEKRQVVVLDVFCTDRDVPTRVAARAHTSARTVCRALGKELGISNHQHFGLVEEIEYSRTGDLMYRSMAHYEKVLDVLADDSFRLKAVKRARKAQHDLQAENTDMPEENDPLDLDIEEHEALEEDARQELELKSLADTRVTLLFQARLYVKSAIQALPDSELELYFLRSTRDVLNGWYPCEEKDMIQLGALQMHSTLLVKKRTATALGASGSLRNVDETDATWLEQEIGLFLPESLLEKRSRNFLVTRLRNEREKLLMLSKREAQLYYIRYLDKWETHGCTFFHAVKMAPSRTMHDEPMVLGVSEKGFHMIDPVTRLQRQLFSYSRIKTYGDHRGNHFLIAAGTEHHEFRFTFKTIHAHQIHDLMSDYIAVLTRYYTEAQ